MSLGIQSGSSHVCVNWTGCSGPLGLIFCLGRLDELLGLGKEESATEAKQRKAHPSSSRRETELEEGLNDTGRTCHESQSQPTLTPAPPIEAPPLPFLFLSGLQPLQIARHPPPRLCQHCPVQWRRLGKSRQNGTRYAFFVHHPDQIPNRSNAS